MLTSILESGVKHLPNYSNHGALLEYPEKRAFTAYLWNKVALVGWHLNKVGGPRSQ